MNLPSLSLHHLHCLTDATGIIQHARLSIPDRHSGHTGDDNRRALVLTVHLQALRPCARADQLLRAYLVFLRPVQWPDGWFMNLAGDDPANPTISRGLLRPLRVGERRGGPCARCCRRPSPHAWRPQTIRGCAKALLGAALLPDACDVTAYVADRLVAAYWRCADRERRFS